MATHSLPLDAIGPPPLRSEEPASDRVPMLGEIQGEILVYQPVRVTEIGRGGATVETAVALQLDSVHDLRLALGHGALVVSGRVVQSRISDISAEVVTYRAALEFVDVTPAALTAIGGFLDGIQASRRGITVT